MERFGNELHVISIKVLTLISVFGLFKTWQKCLIHVEVPYSLFSLPFNTFLNQYKIFKKFHYTIVINF